MLKRLFEADELVAALDSLDQAPNIRDGKTSHGYFVVITT